jgi:hypothetical protein
MRLRLLAIAALACAACARTPPPPRTAVESWRAALERDDAQAAWQLLSADERQRTPLVEFRHRWEAAKEERRVLAGKLAKAPPPTLRAQVLSDGRALAVVAEGTAWRIVAPRSAELGGTTASDLLARVVAAFERRDADAVVRLFADPLRSAVERELADRLDGLRTLARQPIAPDATRVRLRYGGRYYIELVKENGTWLISDLN